MLSLERDWELFEIYDGLNDLMVGVDEAGRGPLAGALVVAGVCFPRGKEIVLPELNDSKKLSEKKRKMLAPLIREQALAYHIEIVDLELIKSLNIYQASKYGMLRCFEEIKKQVAVKFLQTDAMPISFEELPNITVLPIIKGDQKSFHIASASILAKVARDELMEVLDMEFPQYEWKKNKGYPTKRHRELIREFGSSPYHRKGFRLLDN